MYTQIYLLYNCTDITDAEVVVSEHKRYLNSSVGVIRSIFFRKRSLISTTLSDNRFTDSPNLGDGSVNAIKKSSTQTRKNG